MTDLIKQQNELTKQNLELEFGAGADISAEDIYIGRVSIQQANSDLVKQDKARPGQIINTLSQLVLAEKNKPVEFIILKSFKYWIEKEKTQGGEVFKSRFPAQSVHEQDWEDGNIKRYFHHSFYVLLPSDMEMPLELSFKSTELSSAKKLSSFIFKLRVQNKASWDKVFNLSSLLKTKGNNSWFGSELSESRDATEEEKTAARFWAKHLNNIKVLQTEDEESEGVVTPTPNSDLF